jgi:hypothetical protein
MLRAKHLRILLVLAVGCGDDGAPPEEGLGTDGDDTATGGGVTLTGPATGSTTSITDTDPSVGTDSGGGDEVEFVVTIENLSNRTALPTPLSPGAWATHGASARVFMDGEAATPGLETLAENGDPSALANELRARENIGGSGVFDTPRGAGAAGPALPADAFEVTIVASREAPNLSFVTMIAQSNDVFLATPPEGIALFDDQGKAIEATDITSRVMLWDAGTEANEAPAMGRNQAPRQDASNSGPAESGVYPFTHETRGLPIGRAMANVTVEQAGGEFTMVIENVSAEMGAIVTPLSPVFWAVHDESFSFFEDEQARDGLEALAEDGDPSQMVAAHSAAAGVLAAGMQDTPTNAGMPRPADPGERFEIVVTPDADYRWFSFATMVVETNDVFLALPPEGVALVDEQGNPRNTDTIEMEILRQLAAWDAGTEMNEVPGVGLNQAPRQAGPNTGVDEESLMVRRYADAANDLGGAMLGGFMDLEIVGMGDGTFEVTVRNTSAETAYPGLLSPLTWLLHNEAMSLFRAGTAAPLGLEVLAEDGDPMPLFDEVDTADGVMMAGTVAIPDGDAEMRPLEPGEAYVFTVMPEGSARYFDFATMVVPSNDTFAGFGNGGLALLDESGAPRSNAEIANDIAALLRAWDAGTEANQAAAVGPDQAPRQSGPGAGAPQGSGMIRLFEDDPVWIYPTPEEAVRVTIHRRS